jgi:hypothetical protein
MPVPAGCEADRTCACIADSLCGEPTWSCTDIGDNALFCDKGLD